MGFIYGSILGLLKGDTRSLDYSSCGGMVLGHRVSDYQIALTP